jgi:hypothetical protein
MPHTGSVAGRGTARIGADDQQIGAGGLAFMRDTGRDHDRIAGIEIDDGAECRRFGRRRHPAALNIGDCFSCALAAASDDSLLFKGDNFALTNIRPALPWPGA